MLEEDIADLVAMCYGAAAGATPWRDVKQRFCRVMNAPFAGLVTGDTQVDGRAVNLFESETVPLPAWRMRNPFLDVARRVCAGIGGVRPVVALGHEVVDDRQYAQGEYYAEYGRRLEMRHEIGTTVIMGRDSMTSFGVYRPDRHGAFEEHDRSLIIALRPHLRRSLQLRETLRPAVMAGLAGAAALEAIAVALVLVDTELHIMHANGCAIGLAVEGSGLALKAVNGAGSTAMLAAADRRADMALRRLVRSVAILGQPGGALRLPARVPEDSSLIAAVLPLPASLLKGDAASGIAQGLALVLIRDVRVRRPPAPRILCEVFGLSHAEAAIAAMLAQGATAVRIAQARNVSQETVRTQVRSLLRKTGAANLRDLDHMLGVVSGP